MVKRDDEEYMRTHWEFETSTLKFHFLDHVVDNLEIL